MNRMTGPHCAVMCNLINIRTRTTHANESQHLAEGAEVGRLRRRFSFVLQQALSFRTRHHLYRQGVALASTRQVRSQGPVTVQAHRTEGVTGSEGQEGANGSGARLESGAETGTGTGVETRRRTSDGNGDGNGDGSEASSGNRNGDEDNGNGNEDRIGEGGRKAKKR